MASFSYKNALEIVDAEVDMQLERAHRNETQVLHIPILLGPVGSGKTSIGHHVADRLARELFIFNCGEAGDPTEMTGLPVPARIKEIGQDAYMEWVLNKTMHIACTEPVVLLFDDIDKAPPLVEGALIGIFGERKARDRKLHAETVLIAAGNRVQDDALARRLSESLRTRGTVINLEPSFADFADYAQANAEKKVVHPAVLGFLSYRPHLLHKQNLDADRFPTPRGWVEVSAYLHRFEDDARLGAGNAWKTFITLKCGDSAANEFQAWYEIVSKVDVAKILKTGDLVHGGKSVDTNKPLIQYAALFALAQELNTKPIKKEFGGLLKFLRSINPEHVVALRTQLTKQACERIYKVLPECADKLMADIPLGG